MPYVWRLLKQTCWQVTNLFKQLIGCYITIADEVYDGCAKWNVRSVLWPFPYTLANACENSEHPFED